MASSLRIEDFSDMAFLLAVEESIGDEGYATVHMIQANLELNHPYATNCIGSRLGYLRKVGVVDRMDSTPPSRWHLTADGAALLAYKFTPKINIQPQQVLAAMQFVNGKVDGMDKMHQTMFRREFRHGDARRRRWR